MSFDTTKPPLPPNAAQESGGNLDQINQNTADIARPLVDDDGIPYVNPNVPGADIATGDKQSAQIALLTNLQPPLVVPDIISNVNCLGAVVGPVSLNGASRITTTFSGTYSGITVTNEVSPDGVTWIAVRGTQVTGGNLTNGVVAPGPNSITAYVFDVGGFNFYRVRCTVYGSGILNVVISPSFLDGGIGVNAVVEGTAGEGTAASSNPVRIGGWDGVNIRTVSTDPFGVVQVHDAAGVAINGPVSVVPPTTPAVTQEGDAAQYDDDGIPYVNPNVPGADIATGDRQNAQTALLAAIAAANPPPLVLSAVLGTINSATSIVGPITLNGAPSIQTLCYGTYTGVTINPEVSMDGLTWVAIRGVRNSIFFIEGVSTTLGTNETRPIVVDVSGWAFFRLRASAWASGLVQVILQPAIQPAIGAAVTANGNSSTGTTMAGNPVYIGGIDGGGLARGILTETSGAAIVTIRGAGGTALDAVITAATAPVNGIATLVVNETTAPSLATGQSVAVQGDYTGSVFVKPYRRSTSAQANGSIASTTAATMLAAQAAGIFADLGSLCLTLPVLATTPAMITVNISDGTQTYKFGMNTGPSAIAGNGSDKVMMTFEPPIPATNAATAWTIALSAADTTVQYVATFVLQKAS